MLNEGVPRYFLTLQLAPVGIATANVTLVIDDCDDIIEHVIDEDHDKQEAENIAVNEIFKPVGVLQPSALCRNCGESDHTSERKARRKRCLAWNTYCGVCNKRGHYRSVCKSIHSPSGDIELQFGELAALSYVSRVSDLKPITKIKIPHMVYDQLRWISRLPQIAPNIKLSIKVDVQSYRDHRIRPPSSFKHRAADILALADTGCQAVCMGPEQLSKIA